MICDSSYMRGLSLRPGRVGILVDKSPRWIFCWGLNREGRYFRRSSFRGIRRPLNGHARVRPEAAAPVGFAQEVGQFPAIASPAKALFTKGVESAREPLTVPEWSSAG
jgi:hypothetical protein